MAVEDRPGGLVQSALSFLKDFLLEEERGYHEQSYLLRLELEETGRVIGRGAYGEVLELLLHGTKVAGKKIDSKDRESDIKSRIEQECNRLATDVIELHYSQCYMYLER